MEEILEDDKYGLQNRSDGLGDGRGEGRKRVDDS